MGTRADHSRLEYPAFSMLIALISGKAVVTVLEVFKSGQEE
jgi:hypothetical protein